MRGIIATICLLAAFSMQTALCSASEVDELLKKGTDLRRQGRDMEALAEFQKALRLQETPRALAQVALAEQALGLWVEANLHLGQALQKSNDSWIKKNQATLEAARTTIRGHICHVAFWGTPAGADVLIDGKRVGSLPEVETWAAPGEISFEVRSDGFARYQRTMKAPEGGSVREHVELRRLPAESPVAVNLSPPQPQAQPTLALPPPEPTPLIAKDSEPASDVKGNESSGGHNWWLWGILGAVVVAGGVTAALLLTHKSQSLCDRAPCSTWN